VAKQIEAARSMRAGAERLRRVAAKKTNLKRADEMLRFAAELDEHASELERLFGRKRPHAEQKAAAPRNDDGNAVR
jgi:hypothetical protein